MTEYDLERLIQLTQDRPNGTAYKRWIYRAEYERLVALNVRRQTRNADR